MRVAIPIHRGRVAPVFDVSRRLMIFDIEDGEIAGEEEVVIDTIYLPARVSILVNSQVDTVICGAISWPLHQMIEGAGIRVLPNVIGNVKRVVRAFAQGRPLVPAFMAPGCCRQRRRCRWGQRRKQA